MNNLFGFLNFIYISQLLNFKYEFFDFVIFDLINNYSFSMVKNLSKLLFQSIFSKLFSNDCI